MLAEFSLAYRTHQYAVYVEPLYTTRFEKSDNVFVFQDIVDLVLVSDPTFVVFIYTSINLPFYFLFMYAYVSVHGSLS